jgi:hypothetical protein
MKEKSGDKRTRFGERDFLESLQITGKAMRKKRESVMSFNAQEIEDRICGLIPREVTEVEGQECFVNC